MPLEVVLESVICQLAPLSTEVSILTMLTQSEIHWIVSVPWAQRFCPARGEITVKEGGLVVNRRTTDHGLIPHLFVALTRQRYVTPQVMLETARDVSSWSAYSVGDANVESSSTWIRYDCAIAAALHMRRAAWAETPIARSAGASTSGAEGDDRIVKLALLSSHGPPAQLQTLMAVACVSPTKGKRP